MFRYFFTLENTRTLIYCFYLILFTSLTMFGISKCTADDTNNECVENVKYELICATTDSVIDQHNVDFENVTPVVDKKSKPREYKMSQNAHEFIKSFEKCKLTAYRIPGEKYNTIGWGHYLDEKHEQNIKQITQSRADELFAQDIVWVDKAVTSMLNDVNPEYIWPQGIVDGLGSLVFNCGERGVRTTEFYRRLQNCRFENGVINKSDIVYTLASVKTTRCTKRGHYKRRAGEYAMMRENFS